VASFPGGGGERTGFPWAFKGCTIWRGSGKPNVSPGKLCRAVEIERESIGKTAPSFFWGDNADLAVGRDGPWRRGEGGKNRNAPAAPFSPGRKEAMPKWRRRVAGRSWTTPRKGKNFSSSWLNYLRGGRRRTCSNDQEEGEPWFLGRKGIRDPPSFMKEGARLSENIRLGAAIEKGNLAWQCFPKKKKRWGSARNRGSSPEREENEGKALSTPIFLRKKKRAKN